MRREISAVISSHGKVSGAGQARAITVRNPYNSRAIGSVPWAGAEEVDSAVARAAEAARAMAAMPLHVRSDQLNGAADRLIAQGRQMAELITSESGKTIRESRAEVARAAGILRLAAEETRRLHGETIPFDGLPNGIGRTGYWVREPVGVVGAITPWNVPLALAAHKVGPALGAGNAVVLKPAEQTPLNALLFQEIVRQAGVPDNAFQVITGDGETTGDALAGHPGLGFLSFTGSREVGMRLPGRAGYKRVGLELGGNSPVIVTPSANLAAAAEAIVRGGFAVAGQLCISVQRVICHESIRSPLLEQLVPRVAALRVGDPAEDETDVGAMISQEACDRVESQVESARRAGASIVTGGKRAGGSTYLPTVIDNAPHDSPLLREEAFAPLLVLAPYTQIEQAIELANATSYGLNAGIYTNSLEEAMLAAKQIVAGSVMINDVPTFRSDLMPYGGRKQSGLGREGVRFAMEEMCELKVVCFNMG
ncbi:MAG TPA: aldehyde dehydrogenase family protein [Chthonomonadales bacterium]|nr:aldehyde dehydrogenase family protein [Chthonomonadales bacterium]